MNFMIVASEYPEDKEFTLHRESIGDMYIFIHFITPVTAILKGKNTNIKPGGCVFFGRNSMQHFSSACSLLHDWFHADRSCGELMDRYGLECETVYYPEDSAQITELITKIEFEHINRNQFYQEASDALAQTLFITLSRAGKGQAGTPMINSRQKELFVKARSVIHTELAKQWSIKQMADLVFLSESRFYTLYRKYFGVSPQKDLAWKRIQMAGTMLIQEGISIEKCAEITGYTNQYHFIRQFKQFVGISPGKYKKLFHQ